MGDDVEPRREFIDDVREKYEPNYMNFLFDGTNFRGYLYRLCNCFIYVI